MIPDLPFPYRYTPLPQAIMSRTCEARIKTTSFQIPGTHEICWNTTDCKKPAGHKIPVDDGDAFMPICRDCLNIYKTKVSKESVWLGWFDGDYPPAAPIKGSRWYHEMVKKGKENPVPPPAAPVPAPEDVAVDELTESLTKMSIKPSPSPAVSEVDDLTAAIATLSLKPKSEREDIENQIQAIDAWLKGEGKTKYKEQPKKLREKMTLKAKLSLLK